MSNLHTLNASAIFTLAAAKSAASIGVLNPERKALIDGAFFSSTVNGRRLLGSTEHRTSGRHANHLIVCHPSLIGVNSGSYPRTATMCTATEPTSDDRHDLKLPNSIATQMPELVIDRLEVAA